MYGSRVHRLCTSEVRLVWAVNMPLIREMGGVPAKIDRVVLAGQAAKIEVPFHPVL